MKNIMYKKILVPNDGSELSTAALPHAVSLAKAYNAEIVLLQVNKTTQQIIAMTQPVAIYPPVFDIGDTAVEIVKENRKASIRHLNDLKKQMIAEGVSSVEVFVEEGPAADLIVDIAKNQHCDLIVMSTHGRSGLGRTLLGSVADDVIRNGTIPVMVIHPMQISKTAKKGGE